MRRKSTWRILAGSGAALCCATALALAAAGTNNDCVNDGRDGSPFPAGSGSVTISNVGGQVSGAGATLFVDFFRFPASTNDAIDVDNDGRRGTDLGVADPLADSWTSGSPTIPAPGTHWMFQYRSVGSVNGFNEFIGNQACGAKSVNPPSEFGLFQRFQYAASNVIQWADPNVNDGGTPVEPCEIEFSFLDVPSKWAVQVAGAAKWSRAPLQAGYGLNPVLSSAGLVSNLQTLTRECGTCTGGTRNGEPCTVGIDNAAQCPGGTCTTNAVFETMNQNTAAADEDTIFDLVAAWVPVSIISNRGSGVQNLRYSDLQYLFTTGRMPNGENLIAATRSVGSGTRNAIMASLGIDTSWGRGENEGIEFPNDIQGRSGPGGQASNAGGSGNMESAARNQRLAVGYTGLFGPGRAIADVGAGLYEILNVCKDTVAKRCSGSGAICEDVKDCPSGQTCDPIKRCSAASTAAYQLCNVAGDCPGGACVIETPCNCGSFVRPTCSTNVLDNCDSCTSYQIGGNGSFVARGNPDANRDPGMKCTGAGGEDCLVNADCPGGQTCTITKKYCMRTCVGGAEDGRYCGRNADCPGGTCPAGDPDLECNVTANCTGLYPDSICGEKGRCDISYRFCDPDDGASLALDCVSGDSTCTNEQDLKWVVDAALDNQAVADYFNNIEDSIEAFSGTVIRNCTYSGNECTATVPDCQVTLPQTCDPYLRLPTAPAPGAGGYCTYTGVPCALDTDCPDVGPNDIVQVCANRVCSNNDTLACDDNGDCPGGTCPPGRCTLQGGVTCNDEAACPDTTDNVCETVNLSGQLNTPGQFLAATFTLPQGIDCTQTLESGLLFTATDSFNQPLQENIRSTCVATPGYNSVSPTFGGPVPARISIAGFEFSDGEASSFVQYDGAGSAATDYVVLASGTGNLSRRNLIQGDFNRDCLRDISDAAELVEAYYTPRAWGRSSIAQGGAGSCYVGGGVGSQLADYAIPEVTGDFNADGSLTKEDLRYFMDGLSNMGGSLNRRAGAIAVDNAITVNTQPIPWADSAIDLLVRPATIGNEPTFITPKDVNLSGDPFIATGKPYAAGDFRGDVAGGHAQTCVTVVAGPPAVRRCSVDSRSCSVDADCPATQPVAGADPQGWDGYVDGKDIDYCCRRLGNWTELNDANTVVDLSCDMNGTFGVSQADVDELVQVILATDYGDVDLDGDVDDDDRAIIVANQGHACNATTSCTWALGDTNCDGLVNAADLALFAPNGPGVGNDTCHNAAGANLGTPCSKHADCGADICGLKNRYISVMPSVVSVASAPPTVLQVTVVDMPPPAQTLSDLTPLEGDVWYAGVPAVQDEQPPPGGPSLKVALLQCGAGDLRDWGAEGLVHLYGAAIVPGATYAVRACTSVGGSCSEPPLTVQTGAKGDIVTPFRINPGSGQPNFSDISAAVAKFGSSPTAQSKARVQMQPNVPNPAGNVSFSDIGFVVNMFGNVKYPFPSAGCP